MKYLTHVRKTYNYTAKWYDFTGDSVDGRTYMSVPGGTVKFNGGEGPGGNLKIYADQPFKDFIRFDDLKGSDGELLFPDYRSGGANGATFEVRNPQPVLNTWGFVEGYRMLLVRL